MFPAPTNPASKPDRAFSQVDLIVVMAVVAVLLVLVLSAHAKPRNRVFQMTDVSNHRRIMQGMISYTVDHNDVVPNCWGNLYPVWAYGTNMPFGGSGSQSGYETAYPQQLVFLTNGQVFPYVQDPRAFMCPADKPSDPNFWFRNIYITSYVWNGAVNGYGSSLPSTYKLSQFRPDAILEWEADERTPFFFNDSSSFPDENISNRHGTNTFMFGMFGGGVGTVATTAWYGNSLAGTAGSRGGGIPSSLLPNRLWCNPGVANGL